MGLATKKRQKTLYPIRLSIIFDDSSPLPQFGQIATDSSGADGSCASVFKIERI